MGNEFRGADDGDSGPVAPPDVDEGPPAVVERDRLFEALNHRRRRYVCSTLEAGDRRSLVDLATELAAWEHGVDEADVTEHQRDRVYVSLTHVHVPKLVEGNVVEFDGAAGVLSPGEHAEQVRNALTWLDVDAGGGVREPAGRGGE